MTNLERKKAEVDLINVSAAKANLELRILEAQEEITRLSKHIEVQEKTELEIKKKLGKE